MNLTISAPATPQNKAILRKNMMAKRDEWPLSSQSYAASIISQKILAMDIPQRCPISLYWPIGSELDCRSLCQALFDRHHPIGLPVIVAKDQPLSFRTWQPNQKMIPSSMNILIPPADNPTIQPDWLFVPMLAFNRQLYRLGYGGGFYDRTLAALRQKKSIRAIGLAYSIQEIADLPYDLHDARLDMIVTENEMIEDK